MDRRLFDLHAELEESHWWFTARREIVLSLLRDVVPPSPDTLVADVGCGTGANAAAVSSYYRTLGLDISAEAIGHAQARFPAVAFEQAHDLTPLRTRPTLRAALLMDVLEHVPDDFLLLSGLLALMPEGGHVVVTVPAGMQLWSPHDVRFEHYRRYDQARLRQTWWGLPVTERLVSYFNSRLYPLVRVARWVTQRLGHGVGDRGGDLALPPAFVNRLLRSVFAGELPTLRRALDRPGQGFGTGVSLIAILRRDSGTLIPRRKPADLSDPHAPRR